MPADPRTTLIHHPYRAPAGFDAFPVGVHRASTVFFENVAAMRATAWRSKSAYTYGLHGTPTTFTLEERIATLEGGTKCLLAPSGLAAIVLTDVALLRSGDVVLLPDNVYAPSRSFARHELAGWGIGHRVYDPLDVDAFRRALDADVKLVWVEAAGSVTLEFPDLPALTGAAHEHGIPVALDNTWGAGIAFNGFDCGADIVMHALTKYPSGGADVMMGSVAVRDERLHDRLAAAHMHLGLGVGANDAELVLRALPSLALRYAEHDRSAREIARWCSRRPEIARVLHPALEDSPGHANWARLCGAAAGLLSLLFDPRFGSADVDRFVDALKVFRIGYSWAGPVSLAVPYDLGSLRRGPAPYPGSLVRLSIGLEAVADLIADLEQALAQLDGGR